ncbi:MAG: single-stranded DNA-binding protein [Bacteroidia bacterium]|nr:single-stranded DNA-binding protein [Bacteroidia bacterium]
MSVNKAILIGNVGKDPEVRYLENGVAVANFSLATSEVYKNKAGEKITTTEWHNIVLWNRLAETAEKFVKKGTPLFIEGRIRTRQWEDKDGNKRYTTEIVGDNMQLLGRKPETEPNIHPEEKEQAENPNDLTAQQENADDLPF